MTSKHEFFRSLFAACNGKIEIRALPSKKQAFYEIDDQQGIDAFCTQNAGDHLYFGVGTRDGKGGTKANLINIPCVWADVDYKVTPREVLADRLKVFPFKPSDINRSGGGIHLYWLLKESATKDEIPVIEDINKRIAAQLGGDLQACDAARVLRIPDTINHKYPAKCEVAQLTDYRYEIQDFLDILPEVPKSSRESTKEDNATHWLHEAMKGAQQGARNATGTRIAGYWINKLSAKDVLIILQTWNQNNNPPLSESELNTIIKSVSRYEAEKSKSRVDISNVYDAAGMLAEYRDHIKNLKKNRFITGIPEIDKRIRGVGPGEVLTIIARAGSFKTATMQNMFKNYVQNSSWAGVFFSIEMPVPALTERYHEILGGSTGKEIEHIYTSELDGAEEMRKALEASFVKDLKNLYVIPVKVSLSDVAAYVKLIEQHFSLKVGAVGIDYLGLLDGPGSNEYEVISKLSRDTKAMAKMLNIPAILLSQVSRKGGGGEVEISLDMGRGSGAIEEGADFILGLWQSEHPKLPIEDQEPEFDLICRILKNRKGPRGSRWELDLDPSNFRIGPHAEPWEPVRKRKNDVLE